MFRISGYFLCGSKPGGFCTQVWMRLPSKLLYQISSGSVRFSFENSSSLMLVNCLGDEPDVARSRTKRSLTRVGVEITYTSFEASGVARKVVTPWFPEVKSVAF